MWILVLFQEVRVGYSIWTSKKTYPRLLYCRELKPGLYICNASTRHKNHTRCSQPFFSKLSCCILNQQAYLNTCAIEPHTPIKSNPRHHGSRPEEHLSYRCSDADHGGSPASSLRKYRKEAYPRVPPVLAPLAALYVPLLLPFLQQLPLRKPPLRRQTRQTVSRLRRGPPHP
jgi:hypothetical protein